MADAIRELVEQIHASSGQIVLAAAGGGSGAIAELLAVPGASATVLEATIPYAEQAMIDWLGGRPDQFCAPRTARAMAVRAFFRARRYAKPSAVPIGVACTAGLTTNRERRGPHSIHLAVQTTALTASWSLQLRKGMRGRTAEEQLTSRLLIGAIAETCGVDRQAINSVQRESLLEGEVIDQSRCVPPQAWQDLFLAKTEIYRRNRSMSRTIFPGAFNPLHKGHRRMAQIAEETFGEPVSFELSILNVDKPPLDYLEIEHRVGQFSEEQSVFLSRAATFVQKSKLFAGATFVVGVDTLRRIASPSYYNDDPTACSAALSQILEQGCRFLVFGRDMGVGFARLADLDLPDSLLEVCREIPPEKFREDVSSTGIRREKMG